MLFARDRQINIDDFCFFVVLHGRGLAAEDIHFRAGSLDRKEEGEETINSALAVVSSSLVGRRDMSSALTFKRLARSYIIAPK